MQEQYQAIGESAGKVYKVLEGGTALTVKALQREAGVADAGLFNQALGWLAREGKLEFQKRGNSCVISLVGAQAAI